MLLCKTCGKTSPTRYHHSEAMGLGSGRMIQSWWCPHCNSTDTRKIPDPIGSKGPQKTAADRPQSTENNTSRWPMFIGGFLLLLILIYLANH